ncbi:MAG: dodecin domain-containing protein [Oceanospirillales bacterium]|nr:dodecin [Marinobacterium lacunae]MBR9883302.1 dodecin domain-containing protein [Oceanospirillales bacterium]
MPGHNYQIIEIAGSSTSSYEDAIKGAVAEAASRYEHLNWWEVKEMRGHIQDGAVAHYQVVLKIGFRLE